jgi:GDP-L-fucose synthase
MNVIHAAWKNGCKKLEFLGSSCIYPRMAPQPMPESCLLTSELEKTNEAYALAKISGLKYCEFLNRQYGTDYISVMPTNLYGPGDNFDLEKSHVLPAMIRKFHDAKVSGAEHVTLWGTGNPLREFLWSEDMADASVHVLLNVDFKDTYNDAAVNADGIREIRNCHINVGTGIEHTIREVAEKVKAAVGFQGTIVWDTTKPDGTPRKLTDVTKLHQLGWHHTVELDEGIQRLYQWFLEHPEHR